MSYARARGRCGSERKKSRREVSPSEYKQSTVEPEPIASEMGRQVQAQRAPGQASGLGRAATVEAPPSGAVVRRGDRRLTRSTGAYWLLEREWRHYVTGFTGIAEIRKGED